MKLTQCSLTMSIALCMLPQPVPFTEIFARLVEHRSIGRAPSKGTNQQENFGGAQGLTESVRRKLRHEFGFSFLVFRDKIQTELGLSAQQKFSLESYLSATAPTDMAFLQSTDSHSGEFETHRSSAIKKLESKLKETLTEAQRKRLGELVRQREGLFGGPSLWADMQITEDEKSQFMAVIEPMAKQMSMVAAEAQHVTNPIAVQRKVLGLRAELERQLEAVLTESQRKQWKQMLGRPMAIEALFDLSAG